MQEMCLAVPTARLVPTIIEIYDHDYPGHALRRRHRVNVRRRVADAGAGAQYEVGKQVSNEEADRRPLLKLVQHLKGLTGYSPSLWDPVILLLPVLRSTIRST